MRVWIDLANSPHVPLFAPVVDRLSRQGHEVLLTARDHAQTRSLAQTRWPNVQVVGGESPSGRSRKALSILGRTAALSHVGRQRGPDVALSHASYAQVIAAKAVGIPVVTMMDYEHQPANHVSFRLADRLVVPSAFPAAALRRFGASARKVRRYLGFKEELYLAGFRPNRSVLQELGLDPGRVIVVMRPPPEGALYHRLPNGRFEEIVEFTLARNESQVVVLPRTLEQRRRYGRRPGVTIPSAPIDGASLLACADLTVGAGGTMNRESALLGTPTYTVFTARLAAVDAELMRMGKLRDLRAPGTLPTLEKKPPLYEALPAERGDALLNLILSEVEAAAG